jgi:hypothetical protein
MWGAAPIFVVGCKLCCCGLNSRIFVEVDDLWITGSSSRRHSPEKSTSKNCNFQPIIVKIPEKVHRLFHLVVHDSGKS